MKLIVINTISLGLIALNSGVNPQEPIAIPLSSSPSLTQTKPQMVSKSVLSSTIRDFVVMQRDSTLEALRAGQSKPVVLRDHFGLYDWAMAKNGRQLCAASQPSDLNWFGAGSYRRYLFTVNFNSRQEVAMSAYGPHQVHSAEAPDFSTPFYDATGQKFVLSESYIANSLGDRNEYWGAIYRTGTRKRIWDSRVFIAHLAGQKQVKSQLLHCDIYQCALSPDGADMACFASKQVDESPLDFVRPPTMLVHFNLRRKRAEILATFPDPAVIVTRGSSTRIAWHPTRKVFVWDKPIYSAPNPVFGDKDARLQLFQFDLHSHASTRLTSDQYDNFNPCWSSDGANLLWIHGPVYEASPESTEPPGNLNQIWIQSGDAAPTVFAPQIEGVTQIQLVPHLAPWSRYRKLSIQRLTKGTKK